METPYEGVGCEGDEGEGEEGEGEGEEGEEGEGEEGKSVVVCFRSRQSSIIKFVGPRLFMTVFSHHLGPYDFAVSTLKRWRHAHVKNITAVVPLNQSPFSLDRGKAR